MRNGATKFTPKLSPEYPKREDLFSNWDLTVLTAENITLKITTEVDTRIDLH